MWQALGCQHNAVKQLSRSLEDRSAEQYQPIVQAVAVERIRHEGAGRRLTLTLSDGARFVSAVTLTIGEELQAAQTTTV